MRVAFSGVKWLSSNPSKQCSLAVQVPVEQPLANDNDSEDNSTGADAADEAATHDEVSSLWPIFHRKDAIHPL